MQKVKKITLLFTDGILIFFFLVSIGFGDAFRLFPLILLILTMLGLEKFKHNPLELKQWFSYYFFMVMTLLTFYFIRIYEYNASAVFPFIFYLLFVLFYSLICNLKTNLIITTIIYLSFTLCLIKCIDHHLSYLIYSLFVITIVLSFTKSLTVKESFHKLKKRLE